MIELQDFIVASLREITQGVLKAREELKPFGARVVPLVRPSGKERPDALMGTIRLDDDSWTNIHAVEFDVAVETSKESGKDGHLSLKVASVSVGGGLFSKKSGTQHSRVKFTVPFVYPKE